MSKIDELIDLIESCLEGVQGDFPIKYAYRLAQEVRDEQQNMLVDEWADVEIGVTRVMLLTPYSYQSWLGLHINVRAGTLGTIIDKDDFDFKVRFDDYPVFTMKRSEIAIIKEKKDDEQN